MLRQTASQSLTLRPSSESISCTKTAVNDAWALGSTLSLYETRVPFSATAAEQSEVEVSMRIILDICYFFCDSGEVGPGSVEACGQFLEIGEDLACEILQEHICR